MAFSSGLTALIKRHAGELLDFLERYGAGVGTRGFEAIAAQNLAMLLQEERPRLSRAEKRLALQRRWALAFPDREVPDDMKTLEGVIPAGLSARETREWLQASLEDARATFVWILHTSWTLANFWERARRAGVHHALHTFDRRTRKGLEKAMRVFLRD